MKTIYKYNVPVTDTFSLELPAGANVLSFNDIQGKLFLWALVETTADKETRCFKLYGTGHPISNELIEDGSLQYVGTTINTEVGLVWHLFEITE